MRHHPSHRVAVRAAWSMLAVAARRVRLLMASGVVPALVPVAMLAVILLALPVDAGAQTVELSVGPSFTRAESLGQFDLGFVVEGSEAVPEFTLVMTLPLRIDRGWGIAPSVTLHTGNWISHEISYNYAKADLIFDFSRVDYGAYLGDTPLATGSLNGGEPLVERLVIRDMGYAFVANVRPRGARIQPYALVGPRLVAYRFAHAGGSSHSFFRRVGLGSVGSIIGGIRSAKTDPLEGGTIYRWGIGYGGGVRVGLTSTLGLKLDLRQTLIDTPDFAVAEPEELVHIPGVSIAQEDLFIRRFSVSLGATFRF